MIKHTLAYLRLSTIKTYWEGRGGCLRLSGQYGAMLPILPRPLASTNFGNYEYGLYLVGLFLVGLYLVGLYLVRPIYSFMVPTAPQSTRKRIIRPMA